MTTQIRRATKADAAGAIETLHRSITELCFADHQGDALEIDAWLDGKTLDAWTKWIARDDAVVLVADRDGRVVGVGMATFQGKILLNYVHPDVRFTGVSKAVLTEIEMELRSRDIRRCNLESTFTALSFYRGCGFQPEAESALNLAKCL